MRFARRSALSVQSRRATSSGKRNVQLQELTAMTQAAIFDIDGTLVDSVDLHARAWQEAFAKFGQDVAYDEVRQQIGKGGDQLLPVFLTEEQQKRFGKELEEYRGRLFKEKYLSQVKAFPRVRELFQRVEQ